MKRGKQRRRGFTLMEVLLVLVILAILGGLAIGTFTNVQRRANINAAKSQVGLFKSPISTYQLNMNSYPSSLDSLYTQPSDVEDVSKWDGPYMEGSLPKDPWGNPYKYKAPGDKNPNTYDIWSDGPDGQEGTADDIGNWETTEEAA